MKWLLGCLVLTFYLLPGIVGDFTCRCSLCPNRTCVTDKHCYTLVERIKGEEKTSQGCYSESVGLFSCKQFKSNAQQVVCCSTELCNENLTVVLPVLINPDLKMTNAKTSGGGMRIALYIAVPSALVCIIGIVVLMVYNHFQKKKEERLLPFHHVRNGDAETMGEAEPMIRQLMMQNHSIREVIEGTLSMSSGVGVPLLVQRTIARQIVMHECIGRGRFGNVHRGQWNGEDVAVKIFASHEEESWSRETQIYQTTMLRHENILGFIAADNKDVGSWTELLLVTEYHPSGSLYDYLQRTAIDVDAMMKIAYSSACGLAHLHLEIVGTQGKPAMAHRDIKTRNILVKSNGTCCLADLGLAVLHSSSTDAVDVPTNNRIGTKRYLAPEILDNVINTRHFDSYKRADVYALGLVYWEVCRRCINMETERVEDYQPPYFDMIPSDPSLEDVRKVVSIDKKRPQMLAWWFDNQVMTAMMSIMKECWYHDGAARLTSMRIRKSLHTLQSTRTNYLPGALNIAL